MVAVFSVNLLPLFVVVIIIVIIISIIIIIFLPSVV